MLVQNACWIFYTCQYLDPCRVDDDAWLTKVLDSDSPQKSFGVVETFGTDSTVLLLLSQISSFWEEVVSAVAKDESPGVAPF